MGLGIRSGRNLYVIYSPQYLNYYFEQGHPFWPERAKKFLELLKRRKFPFELAEPGKASDEDILLVHTSEYLDKVKEMVASEGYLTPDTPVHKDNLGAAYYYVGGTLKASMLALESPKAVVVNTLGGLHHAESNGSSGFCIFNDHAIAIRKLQEEGKIKKAAILDLDVHAGNGTQEIFYSDPSVLKISLHQNPEDFYPGTGFEWQKGGGKGYGYNVNVILEPGTREKEYLKKLDSVLPKIHEFEPDMLFVVFGADTYKKDPLASVELERSTYRKIGKKLKGFDRKVVLFAGGYSKEVPEIWFELVKGLLYW